jgi:signal transduction histidine kinase
MKINTPRLQLYRNPTLLWLTLLLIALLWLSSTQYHENRTAFFQLSNQIEANVQHTVQANEVILQTLSQLVGPSDLFQHQHLHTIVDALIEHHPQIRAVLLFPSLTEGEEEELVEQYRKYQDPDFVLPEGTTGSALRSPLLFYRGRGEQDEPVPGTDLRTIDVVAATLNSTITNHPLATRPYPIDGINHYLLIGSGQRALSLEDELFPWYREIYVALLIDPTRMVNSPAIVNTSLMLHNPASGAAELLCNNHQQLQQGRLSTLMQPLQHRVRIDSLSQPFLLQVETTIALFQLPSAQWGLILLASLLYFRFTRRRINRELEAQLRQKSSEKRLLINTKNRIQMLNAISHDIRTPLTRLQLRTATMLKGDAKQKSLSDLTEIEQLVEHSLNYLRGEERNEPPQLTDINEMCCTMQIEMGEQGHLFTIQGRARCPYLCQPLQLKRGIQNLLNNAFRFASNIELRLHDHDRNLIIEVLDNGPGLDESLLEKVTLPYFRADDSRNRETGGIGLGLSIVREVVEAHDGNLTLSNRPKGGLKVTLSLPR